MNKFEILLVLLYRLNICFGCVLILNGEDWILDDNENIIVKATVPGNIYKDLEKNFLIENPLYRFNDYAYRWISLKNWKYTKLFQVSSKLLSHNVVMLVVEGIDTVADVVVNNQTIGTVNNMFVQYRFNVTEKLKPGINKIEIKLTSAVKWASEQATSYPYPVPPECPPNVQNGSCHFNFIRKAAYSFSWDWGPNFPGVAIWKSIYLEAYDTIHLDYLTYSTELENSGKIWLLALEMRFSVNRTSHVGVHVTQHELHIDLFRSFKLNTGQNIEYLSIPIESSDVELWWPNGMGDATMYEFKVSMEAEDRGMHQMKQNYSQKNTEKSLTLLEEKLSVGFRTVELVQNNVGEYGLTFYFEINGKPVFAKGSNWIPTSNFLFSSEGCSEPCSCGLNISENCNFDEKYKQKIDWLLRSAVEANMNMLRVWGGGVYETDYFYTKANEYGIMIWQDFMFACALYPSDPTFLKSVEEEVKHQVLRLKNNPSIVVWAGNNENEGALANNWFNISKDSYNLYKKDYITLYVDLIRNITSTLDQNRPFVTSSPSNGLESVVEGWVADDPQSTSFGDIHFYDYFSDLWNVSNLRTPRFASEFGVQSWPSFQSLIPVSNHEHHKKNSVDADLRLMSKFALHRQHHQHGEFEILYGITRHIDIPFYQNKTQEFIDYIFFGQINQAMSIKLQVEHYRRAAGRLWNAKKGIYERIPEYDLFSHHQNQLQADQIDTMMKISTERMQEKGRKETGRRRVREGFTMGALYWQLNDVWQAPSWSSIEYSGNWKMLHYHAKKFFATHLVSSYFVDVETDAEHIGKEAVLRVYFTQNDVLNRRDNNTFTLAIQCVNSEEATYTKWTKAFEQESSSTLAYSINKEHLATKCHSSDINLSGFYLVLQVYNLFGELVCSNFQFLSKRIFPWQVQPPYIEVSNVEKIDDYTVNFVVACRGVCLFVWLEYFGSLGTFSDNGFMLTSSQSNITFKSVSKIESSMSFEENLNVQFLGDIRRK